MNNDLKIVPIGARQIDQALIDMMARLRDSLIQVRVQPLTVPALPADVVRLCSEYAMRTGFAAGVAMAAIQQIESAFPQLTKPDRLNA